jgi:hypothetical protein
VSTAPNRLTPCGWSPSPEEQDRQRHAGRHPDRDQRRHHQHGEQFRQHRVGVRDRQRLPEQDAAVAPVVVERGQAVEEGHDRQHEEDRRTDRDVVVGRHAGHVGAFSGVRTLATEVWLHFFAVDLGC